MVADLSTYYNLALVSRRAVVTDVHTNVWQFDLASSLAAVLFARELVEEPHPPHIALQNPFPSLIAALCSDISEPWFHFAVRNARRPTMIAMPSLPALNLGMDEERYYIQAVSDSWPNKNVSVLDHHVIRVSSTASRRFVDDMVAGDLGGLELPVTDHERSFLQSHSIGWITRYETVNRTVTIIEVDPWAPNELNLDPKFRRQAHHMVKVPEESLGLYSLGMKLHSGEEFANNLILSRLLTIDQMRSPIHHQTDLIDVLQYIHVRGSGMSDLGPVDEEVLLKSLGSMTAKNKLRSAIAISAKARLTALHNRGASIRSIAVANSAKSCKSRMIRCGVDGIYVRTRAPYDSLLVLVAVAVIVAISCRALIRTEGVRSVADATSLSVALILGVSITYHSVRYKSWSMGETVRLRRMCISDEEMSLSMSKNEMISTIAEAGSKGAGMDGILTCAYSDSANGKFSVTLPLDLEAGARVGLVLRLSAALKPLWVDLKGVRAVENNGMWHAYGPYLEKAYLMLTATGPSEIGGRSRPQSCKSIPLAIADCWRNVCVKVEKLRKSIWPDDVQLNCKSFADSARFCGHDVCGWP